MKKDKRERITAVVGGGVDFRRGKAAKVHRARPVEFRQSGKRRKSA